MRDEATITYKRASENKPYDLILVQGLSHKHQRLSQSLGLSRLAKVIYYFGPEPLTELQGPQIESK